MLASRPQNQCSSAILQVLYRQTIAPQHLTNGDGGSALLVSLNAVRQNLPTEKNIC